MTSADWRDERMGVWGGHGHPRCLGCGTTIAVVALAIPEGWEPPEPPDFPFPPGDCPMCVMRGYLIWPDCVEVLREARQYVPILQRREIDKILNLADRQRSRSEALPNPAE